MRHGSVPVQSSSVILEAGGVAFEKLVDQAQQGGAHSLSIRGVMHEARPQQEGRLGLRCILQHSYERAGVQ